MAYARRCCRDSVAARLAQMDGDPPEGMRVDCRYGLHCYAVFTHGAWDFRDELSDAIDRMTSPEASADRAAMLADIRGHRVAREMKEK
jgi:hypothetical protein